MRQIAVSTTAFFILLFAFPSVSAAFSTQLKTLRTKDLRLVYIEGNQHITPHLTRCFENSMEFYRQLFGYTPSEEITILMPLEE